MSEARSSVWRAIGRWSLGLLLALLVVRMLAPVLVNSISPHEWDPALETSIRRPGTVHRHVTEGWGESVAGAHGVFAVPDISAITGDAVAVWGDSYVEQLGVDDEHKIGPQLTALLARTGARPEVAFGIGAGGANMARVAYLIERYEELVPTITAHYIVIGRTHFIRPQDPPQDEHALVSQPAPGFHHAPQHPRRQGLTALLHDTGFDFLLKMYGRLRKTSLRFSLGTYQSPDTSSAREPAATEADVAAWRFAIDALRSRSRAPIVFVYCPDLPRIEEAAIVTDDRGAEVVTPFRTACEQQGVPFIHLGQRFIDFHRETGRFPRGFLNGRPAHGHLNADGVRLLAEAIAADREAR